MCGKGRQGSSAATELRAHCHEELQGLGEKKVPGPGWVTPPPLVPKTEARGVSGSTSVPLRARAVITECICCDSARFFPSLFSLKAVMDVIASY